MCPGVGPEGWLRWFLYPFGVQEACTVPCSCSQLFRGGSWGFLVFSYLIVHDLPQLACLQLFLVPYSFFVLCCWRRQVSRYKQCCKGSWVPACLTSKASSFSCGCCSVSLGQVPAQSPPWARWPPTLLCVPAASHAHASEPFYAGAAAGP